MKNILIFGWFGAHKNQLLKFQKLYKELGHNVIIIPTEIHKTTNPIDWNKWKKNGPIELNNKKFDAVHIFSGGVFKYHCWTINNYDCLGHSKIIYDSSPFFPLPEQFANYIINQLPVIKNIPNSQEYICNIVDKLWYMCGYNSKDKLHEFTSNLDCGRPKMII